MITLGKIAEWVLDNRRGKAFVRYTLKETLDEITWCSDKRTIIVVTDDNGYIVGVTTGRVDVNENVFFVYNVLTTKPGIFQQMKQWIHTNFPGYTIEGVIRGIRRIQYRQSQQTVNRI